MFSILQSNRSSFPPHLWTFSTFSSRFCLTSKLGVRDDTPSFASHLPYLSPPFLSNVLLSILYPHRSPLSLFHTSSFLSLFLSSIPLWFPTFLPPSLPPLYTVLHPSLSPSSTLHSQGILWLIALFSFFPSPLSSLSLIRPGVFCSIYHLDEALPQFINTLYSRVHTCAQACLRLFLLTCIQ